MLCDKGEGERMTFENMDAVEACVYWKISKSSGCMLSQLGRCTPLVGFTPVTCVRVIR